ncbi:MULTISPECIES: amino acid ABC transporter permease [Ligilactobacillus]|jgi:polar amino acid transport system permease protein|uniref:Polar amino acid ABC transporter, permease protein n=7 Tax=Ligilactobacillus salivarius TaxID=1624 RepID=Q1WT87_LIGS1|nr:MULTISPECIES: amino acid ABC transporter permease [Ligilactobacillus]MBN2920769.1 amino acid ABC transporter permease [Lactobacillus sp.]PEG97087.1 amino acid ABC transporter permease [Lactobacillus sp. UMNPBX9]PEH10149.1 amino acid ABC transporter permease [Lactobacillus sp. UMNPBX2]CDK34904.1 Polar amino acid ABC transporter, permease protein [Ligilactobacillus salivarius cp400]ABD99871.1 Polar amino acid ABC transporter, permease protein [Ligilactobacillus salivarius UCC118]
MNYVLEVLPSLLDGAKMTLQIFCWTLIGSLPLGLIVGLALISRFRLLKAILRFYVWLMRGTPLLLQLIFVFYGLPLVGLTLGRFDAALFAFILNYTAYFAEIFRGGLQSIDKGQYESAKVLRLTYWQTIRKIVTPQVVKIVLPSIGNEVINLVKDSSLVYVIGIGDLLRAGNVATSRDVTLVPLVMVGVVYLVMTAVLTFILRKLEQYYSYWK